MLQEELWRSRMLSTCCSNLALQCQDVQEEQAVAEDKIRESGLKLFAVRVMNFLVFILLPLLRYPQYV
jgi:hypothetical protein